MEHVIVCIFSTVLFKDEYCHFAINLNEGYFIYGLIDKQGPHLKTEIRYSTTH